MMVKSTAKLEQLKTIRENSLSSRLKEIEK